MAEEDQKRRNFIKDEIERLEQLRKAKTESERDHIKSLETLTRESEKLQETLQREKDNQEEILFKIQKE